MKRERERERESLRRKRRREEEQEEERKKEGKTRMERKKTFVRPNFHYFLISYERNTDQPSQFYPSRSDARQEMRDKDRASTIIGYGVYNRWRSKVKSQQEEKSDERGLVFFFFFSFSSLLYLELDFSSLLPTSPPSTYVTIRAGLIEDFTRTLPRRSRAHVISIFFIAISFTFSNVCPRRCSVGII